MLFTPWWRSALLIASVIWAVVFAFAAMTTFASLRETLGIVSSVPLWALLIDALIRDARGSRPAE